MKKKTKTIVLICAAVLFVLLLVPVKAALKDGGSVSYHAVLYNVTKVHEFHEPEGYRDGLKIEILGQTVYSNEEPIGIADGVYYGMSPKSIEALYGTSPEKSTADDSPWMWYRYPMGGGDSVSFGFFRSFLKWELRSAHMECSDRAVSEQLRDKLRRTYADDPNYYETESENQIELGLHYGATGISCTIKKTEDGVSAFCQKAE